MCLHQKLTAGNFSISETPADYLPSEDPVNQDVFTLRISLTGLTRLNICYYIQGLLKVTPIVYPMLLCGI